MKPTVVVTGSTKGIGLAISHQLDSLGWDVVGIARHPTQMPFPGTLYCCDLSSAEQTTQTLAEIQQKHCVNGIVNNVGFARPQALADLALDDLYAVLNINLRAAIQVTQSLLPHMLEQQWGRIVNIASRAMLGKTACTSFSAAKAGLDAVTKTWAMEFAKQSITVNTVAPGPINTEQFSTAYPKGSEAERRIIDGLPVGRIGETEEVAHAVAFLLDQKSGFITGQTLFVDGGGSLGVR